MTVYVMGYGRSGSTLFESLLVRSKALNAFGEIKYFPERGVIKNEKCSCGEVVSSCDFWSEVHNQLGEWDYEYLVKLTNQFESSKLFFINLILLKLGINQTRLAYYQDFNIKLLQLLSSYGDFIDSSKMPARLFFINYKNKGFYSKVYWLTRDPRGVAFSCMKDIARPEATDKSNAKMPKFGFVSSLIKWNINYVVSNYVHEKYKSLSEHIWYEDVVKMTWDEGNEDFSPLKHSVSGNPRRFNGGLESIKVDDKWKVGLSRFQNKLALLLTKPFFTGR